MAALTGASQGLNFLPGHNREKGMIKAKQASYFLLCKDCGKHGHIVYANGKKKSSEFSTISKGLDQLTALVVAREISWDDSLEIEGQIRTSDLLLEDRDMDAYTEWLVASDAAEQRMFEESDDQRESVARRKGRTLN